jgi:hypothetical protein
VLVVPDRLGALHDATAATLAARARGAQLDAILVNAPLTADASTGSNADELRMLLPEMETFGPTPRAPAEELAAHEEIAAVLRRLRT